MFNKSVRKKIDFGYLDLYDIKKEPSDAYLLGLILALVGGFLDAYTYIEGHVFANAQTGNIILMAINLADANYSRSLHYLIPILSFMAGVVVSEMIRLKCQYSSIHWRQIIIALEILTLLFVTTHLIPLSNLLITSSISFVSSMQISSFKHIGGNALSTVTCTNNLRTATEHMFRSKIGKEDKMKYSIQYYGIILFFIFGAIISYYLTRLYNELSLIFPVIILSVVFLIMFIKPNK